MAQTRVFAVICAGILAVTVIGLVLLLVFGNLGLQLQGDIALVLGAVLTMALTMLLMGLVFLSDRSGQDETAQLDRTSGDHDNQREPP
jgi:hypothetical protein